MRFDLGVLCAMAAKAKRASRAALAAHDTASRKELLDARKTLYGKHPLLVPESYADQVDVPSSPPSSSSQPVTSSSLAAAADATARTVEPATSLDAPVPKQFDSSYRAVPRSAGLYPPNDLLRDAAVPQLAGAYLDAERTLAIEYVVACRRWGHMLAAHSSRFNQAVAGLRAATKGSLDADYGVSDALAAARRAVADQLGDLRACAAAVGLAMCGGHASGVQRYKKLSDSTYVDTGSGVVVQSWPCRALLNAHIDALNELLNAPGSTFFVPLVAAVDVLGRCFSATPLIHLQAEHPVSMQPLKTPYLKFQLERATVAANFFFTNSNHAKSSDGKAATAAASSLSPTLDEALVSAHTLVVFGADARVYVVAARGFFPLLSFRLLRQASASSPHRGLTSMLHYFDDVLAGRKASATASSPTASTALLDDDDEAKRRVEEELLLFSSKDLSKAKRQAAKKKVDAARAAESGGPSGSSIAAGLRHVLGEAVSVLDTVVEDLLSRAAARAAVAGGVADTMHLHGLSIRYLLSVHERLVEKYKARVAVNDDPVFAKLAEQPDSPFGTFDNDVRLLNEALRSVVTEVFARVLKHVVIQAWWSEFNDCHSVGRKPPIAAMAKVVDSILLLVFPVPRDPVTGELTIVPFAERPMAPRSREHLTKAAVALFEPPRQRGRASDWDELHISAALIAGRLCAMCGCTFGAGKVTNCVPIQVNHVQLCLPERIRLSVMGRERLVLTALMQQLRFARKHAPRTVHLLALGLVDLYTQASVGSISSGDRRPQHAASDAEQDTTGAGGAPPMGAETRSIDELLSLVYPSTRDAERAEGWAASAGDPTPTSAIAFLSEDESQHLKTEVLTRRLLMLVNVEAAKKKPDFGETFFDTMRSYFADFTEHVINVARGSGESQQLALLADRVVHTCACLTNLEEQRTLIGHVAEAESNTTGTIGQHTVRDQRRRAARASQRAGGSAESSKPPAAASRPSRAAKQQHAATTDGAAIVSVHATGNRMAADMEVDEEDGGAEETTVVGKKKKNSAPSHPTNSNNDEMMVMDAFDDGFSSASPTQQVAATAGSHSSPWGSTGGIPDRTLRMLAGFPAQCVDALNSQTGAPAPRTERRTVAWLYELLFDARWAVRSGFDRDGLLYGDDAGASASVNASLLEIAREKAEFYSGILGPQSAQALSAATDVGTALARLQRFDEARVHYEGMVRDLEGSAHPNRFVPQLNLAYVHYALASRMTPAHVKSAKNKGLKLSLPALAHLTAAEDILQSLVDFHAREARSEVAAPLLTPLFMADVFNNQGAVLSFKRKYSTAIGAFNRSLAQTAGTASDSHPDRALAIRNIKVCKRRQYDNALYFLRLWARRHKASLRVDEMRRQRVSALAIGPIGRAFMVRRLLGLAMRRRYHGVKHTTWRAAMLIQAVGRGFSMRVMMQRAQRSMQKRALRNRRAFAIRQEAAVQDPPKGPALNPPPDESRRDDEQQPTVLLPPPPAVDEPEKPKEEDEVVEDDETAPARELRKRRGNLGRLPNTKILAPYPAPHPTETEPVKPAMASSPPPRPPTTAVKDPTGAIAASKAPSVAGSILAVPRDPLQAAAVVAYFRQRLMALYAFYGLPKKLPLIDKNLEKYVGQEADFLAAMTEKYGPEPPKERRAELVTRALAMCPALRSTMPPPPPQQQQHAPSAVKHSADAFVTPKKPPSRVAGEEDAASVCSRASSVASSSRAPRSERSARHSAGLGSGSGTRGKGNKKRVAATEVQQQPPSSLTADMLAALPPGNDNASQLSGIPAVVDVSSPKKQKVVDDARRFDDAVATIQSVARGVEARRLLGMLWHHQQRRRKQKAAPQEPGSPVAGSPTTVAGGGLNASRARRQQQQQPSTTTSTGTAAVAGGGTSGGARIEIDLDAL